MIWKTLMILTLSEQPVIIVFSGSMEHLYYRGDILFLYHREQNMLCGDVVVYRNGEQETLIVHRIIAAQEKEGEEYFILTKGDNNSTDDRDLYSPQKLWIHKKNILGKVKGYLPYLGMVPIIYNDNPVLKHLAIGIMSIIFLITHPQG